MRDAAHTPQIDYAPPPSRRRRRAAFALVLLAAVVLAGSAARRWGRPYWGQVVYLYWQDRAMRWRAPADLTAYDEDDQRVPALMARADYQAVSLGAPLATGLAPAPAGHVPPPLGRLGGNWVSMCFLHGRYTPTGDKRLGWAAVTVDPEPGGGRTVRIYGGGKTLAGLAPGTQIRGGSSHDLRIKLAPADRLRVFSGQPDPADRTRFTMTYELNGTPGTVEGRLDNGGSFAFTVLDGPAVGRVVP